MMTEEQIINYAISQKHIGYAELAQILHYTKTDILYVNLFLDSIKNREWIFLTKNMISEWFGIKYGKNTLQKYEKILMSNFSLNEDFKKTYKENKIIKKWSKFDKDIFNKTFSIDDYNGVYYIISSNAFSYLIEESIIKNRRILIAYKKTENILDLMSKIKIKKKERSIMNIILKKLNLLK